MLACKNKISNNCFVKKYSLLKTVFFLAIMIVLPVTKAVASEQYISLSRNFLNVNIQAEGDAPEPENYMRYLYATAGAGYSAIYGYNFQTATKGLGIEIGYQINETEKRTRNFVEADSDGNPEPAPFLSFNDNSYVGTTQIQYTRLYADARYYYPIFQRTATPAALHIGVGITQTTSNFLLNGVTLHNETYTSLGNFVLGVRVKFRENAFLYIDYQSFFPYLIAQDFAFSDGTQKFTVEAASNTIGVAILFGSKK
ncbi:MAG: porin family protein [Alphaproteobacteria bacterium]|nr:porin family protein [Alphaproteobacteria bacterium]